MPLSAALGPQCCDLQHLPLIGPPTIAPAAVPLATGPDALTGHALPVRRAVVRSPRIPSH
jgi:hypothetical protein